MVVVDVMMFVLKVSMVMFAKMPMKQPTRSMEMMPPVRVRYESS